MQLSPALPLAALAALSACMSAAPAVEQTMPISTMNTAPAPAPIVPPEGPFVWACSVTGVSSGAQWQFAIVEQANETGSETLLETAGVNAAYPLDHRQAEGLDSYHAGAGGDRIEVMQDGSARLFWGGAAEANYSGHCLKGISS